VHIHDLSDPEPRTIRFAQALGENQEPSILEHKAMLHYGPQQRSTPQLMIPSFWTNQLLAIQLVGAELLVAMTSLSPLLYPVQN
jgi:hypothetical protein